MRAGLIAYIAGLTLASLTPRPEVSTGVVLAAVAVSMCWAASRSSGFRRKTTVLAAAALLGFAWHLVWAGSRLDAQLAPELEGRDMLVGGIVRGLPRRFDEIQQFTFEIRQSDSGLEGRKVLLNHYGEEEILAGKAYRFEVRMNRPRGLANPGVFDYEAWLFQRGIAARGYVRGHVEAAPELGTAWLDSLRASLKSEILRLARDPATAGIIVALALGDDSGLTDDQWELFRQTGTNHLFVISGLHIGLICLLAYGITLFTVKRFPTLMLLAPAQKIALLPALAAACAYGSISGFGLPAQRALVMAAVFMLASLFNIKQPASLRFLLAMAVVLTLNPLSFLGMGFWLSFLAVAALLLAQRPDTRPTGPTTWLMASLRPQLAVAAGLLVPLLFWMGEVSLLGPLVNIPAIPLVGFCVVPLCLLAACSIPFSETLAETLLQPATWLLQLLLWSLENAVALSSDIAILDRDAPATLTLALLAAGSLLALMPKGFPGRQLTPLLMLPLLFTPAKATREDLLRLHILDVGQGLAIIVQTRRHTLLYDTGASFSPDASMGDRVVLPVLKKMNTPKLDAVILSHSDDDHSGGFQAIAKTLPIDRLYSSFKVPQATSPTYTCRNYINWHWDNVNFRFLHPNTPQENDNDNSCVLQIQAGNFTAILPGDIESTVERNLAATLREELRSNLLIAAHHGSNTSSSWPFLKMTNPNYIVFAAGYRNSFGHPSPRVLERSAAFTRNLLNTSTEGMISFVLPKPGAKVQVSGFRTDHPRYWREGPAQRESPSGE
ncbi:MAG: DNA internalization-related competence protein ComEC/Rec2 [Gammaproteobacteria bacterium]|nr:DNA internalization-related competence protein ComEC/Rec2 [Gammaproteobacteria bacterium]